MEKWQKENSLSYEFRNVTDDISAKGSSDKKSKKLNQGNQKFPILVSNTRLPGQMFIGGLQNMGICKTISPKGLL